MKKSMMALLICVVFVFATAAASFAAMGEGSVGTSKGVDITLFGSNRVIPTYTKNLLDFDSDHHDAGTLTEGGWGSGFFVRNEFRMGWKGVGQDGKWGFKFILENDIHMSKNNGDRNTYGGYGQNSSDFGSEFSVERQTFWYKFGDVRFSAGTDIQFLDIKSGGLVYGDDHPFLALDGGDKALNWKLFMLLIGESDDLMTSDYRNFDWYVYGAKLNYTFETADKGKFTISPFAAYSDCREGAQKGHSGNVHAYYYGLEGYGNFGMIQPTFELAGVTGDIKDALAGDDINIQSYAAFAALTLAVSPEFNPYLAFLWEQGDDDPFDDDADGFVGITSIQRYTPVIGMEGGIMYEHMSSIGAPLYGLVPEGLGISTAYNYGGISMGGNGQNPGMQYYGIGAKGKLSGGNSYKVQVAYMLFDEEKALEFGPHPDVDDEIGWVLDAQVKHVFSDHFYMVGTFSCLDPGDGVEDYVGNDDVAINTNIELGWKW